MISNLIGHSIAKTLVECNAIRQEELALYEYSFSYLSENVLYYSITILAGALSGNLSASVLILIILTALRCCGGGAHASHPLICVIITYGQTLFILHYVPILTHIKHFSWIVLLLISDTIILLLAPVNHINKQLNVTQHISLRKRCLFSIAVINLLFFILIALNYRKLYITTVICVMISSISEVIGHLTNGASHERKNRNL